MLTWKLENKIISFIAASILTCCMLYLIFVLLRYVVVAALGVKWYVIGEWSWAYTAEVISWLAFFAFEVACVKVRWMIKIWRLRSHVVVDDHELADYSPMKACRRREFSESTKDAAIRRTMRLCGGKLLCAYTRREVCFEHQVNKNDFTMDDLIEFDHLIPPQYGGGNDLDNCVVVRRQPNREKHDDIKPPFADIVIEKLKERKKTIHRDCLQ